MHLLVVSSDVLHLTKGIVRIDRLKHVHQLVLSLHLLLSKEHRMNLLLGVHGCLFIDQN